MEKKAILYPLRLSTVFHRYAHLFHSLFHRPNSRPKHKKSGFPQECTGPTTATALNVKKPKKMTWIRELFYKYNLGEEFERQEVLVLWAYVLGPSLQALTRAVRVAHSVLWVEVASPTLAHELSFFTEQYLDKINAHFSEPVVRAIRFIPGSFRGAETKKTVPITSEDRAAARALFDTLSDPHLRKAFERLYLAHRQREETLLAAGETRCSCCGVVFPPPGDRCPGCRFDAIEDLEKTG